MVPSLILDPKPGDLVLDMCAAPGSKTGQLMEMVLASGGDGAVVANDPDVKRAGMMIHRTKTLATPSLVVTAVPGQVFPHLRLHGQNLYFDRVLCDVPCSGDGTLRKNWVNMGRWKINHGVNLHLLQLQLLKRSLELVKVGGYVVYSTCSINPIENEVCASVLLRGVQRHAHMLRIDQLRKGMVSFYALLALLQMPNGCEMHSFC